MIPCSYSYSSAEKLTKRILISDIARLYDVLGSCSSIILLQRLWEAAVKSFKAQIRKVVEETKLTLEELTTMLAHIEACLNYRPLTPLPEASNGADVLTTGQFLIGRPLTHIIARPLQFPIDLAITLSHRCMESVSNTNSPLSASLVFRKLER